jgi:DNA-binding beta-propeller fold protein YncE
MSAVRKVLLTVVLLALASAGSATGATRSGGPLAPGVLGDPSLGAERVASDRSKPSPGAVPRTGTRIPLGVGPQASELSRATGTLYVANDLAGTVAVIDAAGCSARRNAACGAPVATITVGPDPVDVGIDDATRTVYVSSAARGTVAVVDARRCHARDTSGCGAVPATVPVGGTPIGVDVDERTHTVYVGSEQDHVSVIDGRTCNASDSRGCSRAPATVAAGPGPLWPTVDESTDTLYVPDHGAPEGPPGTTMSVIDARTCNAVTTTGCAEPPAKVAVGAGPTQAAVDRATRTVYVANEFDLTVSVVDAARCSGRDVTGCEQQQPPTVEVGAEPNSNLVIDERLRTLYVANTGSDTLSVVDVGRCSARRPAGCAQPPRTMATGNQPFWVLLDPATHTLYVNERVDQDVLVLDAAGCSARRRSHCRREAPTLAVPSGALSAVVDPVHHTLHLPSGRALSLLDTRRCRARSLVGCEEALTQLELPAEFPRDAVVDRATRTLYVADPVTDRLLVLDTRTCNATSTGGCTPVATVPGGGQPVALALNARTHTVYAANFATGTVSVVLGARCNAIDRSGCAETPRTAAVGPQPLGVAVDAGTNTVYVANADFAGGSRTVSVLDGAACESGRTCAAVATAIAGPQPIGLDLDRGTHTLYVANNAGGDAPGSLSVIDTRTCSAAVTTGCGQEPPTVPTGRGPWAVLVDPGTHRVFTANFSNATVSVVAGAICNATTQVGCDRPARRIPVGDIPLDLALDRRRQTLYVTNAPDRTVSVIDARRPCATPVRCLD